MISSFVTRWTPDNLQKWTKRKARREWKEEKKTGKKYVESRRSKRELSNAACRHLHILKVLALGFLSAEIIGEKNISRTQQSGRRLSLRSSKIPALSRCNPTILPFPTSSEMVLIPGRISSPSKIPSLLPLCICAMQSNVPEFPHSPQTQNDSQERGSGLLSPLCLQSCQWLVKLAWNLTFKVCWKIASCVRQEASTSSGFLGARSGCTQITKMFSSTFYADEIRHLSCARKSGWEKPGPLQDGSFVWKRVQKKNWNKLA